MSLRPFVPASSPFSIFSGFDELFHPLGEDIIPTPFLTNLGRSSDMALRRTSPCYEITENDEQFQLAIDVPGVEAGAIDVHLGDGNRVLHISGGRQVKQTAKDGSITESESRFEKKFVLDKTIDSSKMAATLDNGVLTIIAPKHVATDEVKKIPVVQGSSKTVDISSTKAQHASGQ
eukprot:800498_1